jgi:hypothetical protein
MTTGALQSWIFSMTFCGSRTSWMTMHQVAGTLTTWLHISNFIRAPRSGANSGLHAITGNSRTLQLTELSLSRSLNYWTPIYKFSEIPLQNIYHKLFL